MTQINPSSRRAVLRAGAWTAPVVVLATAAPAAAASGPADISVTVPTTTDDNGTMPITIIFTNKNTRTSGPLQLFVECKLSQLAPLRSIPSQTPANISDGGWVVTGQGGTDTSRMFGLRREAGIPGAPTPTSTSELTLRFDVVVAGPTAAPSTGTIIVTAGIQLGLGTFTPGSGSWT